MKQQPKALRGFALPTVLIASVVMLTVLAVAVSSVAAVRVSLRSQYYEQLAKAAGEAGVAYAKACLAKNSNVPLWTNAKPLTPSTDCAGNVNSDPPKYVVEDATMRSSFSVGMPALDNGRARTLPHTGYVELLRASNGAVWRTYRQPAVQATVVPDLCSGAATSGLGWSSAAVATSANQISLVGAPTAVAISPASTPVPAGRMYFRKDFTVTETKEYQVSVLTRGASDVADIYIDGEYQTTSKGALGNKTVSLSAGCHTISARLTNKTVAPGYSQFAASISNKGSSSALVATDSSWRVSTGAPVSFSSTDFYADPDVWTPVTVVWSAETSLSTWPSVTGDPFTQYVAPSCVSLCPPSSSTYLRSASSFRLTGTGTTDVLVSSICDDDCRIYIDGNLVMLSEGQGSSLLTQRTIPLPAGEHQVGVRLTNTNTVPNPSKVAVSLRAGGAVVARTDGTWRTVSNTWFAGSSDANNPVSYEDSFLPSPLDGLAQETYEVLVVGGGGGGGGASTLSGGGAGGGGGGVRYEKYVAAKVGTQTVQVGAGGAAGASNGATGATTSTINGKNGGSSSYGTILAHGGGGGAGQFAGTAAAGFDGGSGGGGAGGATPIGGPGGAAINNAAFNYPQGFGGGGGGQANPYNGGGGGGAGGPGISALGLAASGGNGGGGFISYITGARMVVGGGGGGGTYDAVATGGLADPGSGGTGASSTTNSGNGYAGTANRGGGGGGANGRPMGASGGAGGSGIVAVRLRTNKVVYTIGSGCTSSSNTSPIDGVLYTVITFTAGTCSFTITAVNP